MGKTNCSKSRKSTPRTKNIAGQKFNRLTAIKVVGKDSGGNVMWEFKCDCGKTIIARGSHVTHDQVKSCGCLLSEWNHENHGKHLHTFTRLYRI